MNKRKDHWEAVYQNRDPLEVSWYQKAPTLSMQLIEESGVGKEAAIIDVGGGASLLVDHLLEAGYQHLSVLDISANALQHSQQRLGETAQRVEWLDTDITHFHPPHPYRLWHDRAVFHFLTNPEDRQRYVEIMKQALQPGAHLVIAAFAIDGPKQCSGLDIVQYDAEKLMDALNGGFILIETLSEAHTTPAQKVQQFNYFHLQREAN